MSLHALVEKTKKGADKTNLDKGCIMGWRSGLNIRVSPKSFERALKIMDILIKALEAKGAQVSIVKREYHKDTTSVKISGVTLEIDIYEKINIIKKEKDQYGFNLDYIPNGQLVLRIKDTYINRSEWKDGKRKKVEDQIDSFIDGLYAAVEREKELQKEREQEKEEWRKREEEERLREIEQERFNDLKKKALCWHESQIIQTYIEAATAAYVQKNGKIESGSEFDQWKKWATERVNSLNSLLERPNVRPEEADT